LDSGLVRMQDARSAIAETSFYARATTGIASGVNWRGRTIMGKWCGRTSMGGRQSDLCVIGWELSGFQQPFTLNSTERW